MTEVCEAKGNWRGKSNYLIGQQQTNLSNRSSGVQIPHDICTRLGRYLYSMRCSCIIIHEYFTVLCFYLRKVTREKCITSHFRLMVHLQPHGMILFMNYLDSVHFACLFMMQCGHNYNHVKKVCDKFALVVLFPAHAPNKQ